MEFKGQYLNYLEYIKFGGTLEEVPFNLLEYDVRKIIDERTQRRLTEINDIPFDVKICVFKMINVMKQYQELEIQNKNISSENIDGYNISYKKLEKSDIETKEKELENIIMTNLNNVIVDGVSVLYLGVQK